MDFLSEYNITLHMGYLNKQKNLYSVMEKSYPEIKGLSIEKIKRMRIPTRDKEEIFRLFGLILGHEVFFSSFDSSYRSSPAVRKSFGSEANFLYEMYSLAKDREGFLFIHKDNGKITFDVYSDFSKCIPKRPILAIDLAEHAYFYDYAFSKEDYLRAALKSLNLSLLE